MTAINPQTSFNFAVAKVVAILLVVTGHFFDGSLLWIPVTVGLFVFAYSSAYFTTKKYAVDFEQKAFWANKIGRLAIPFWITQGFLLLLFLLTGRDGIWTWQTVVHWLGQSGWLNWFAISNASPFGSGLWFFTLLLIFYLLYPLLLRWNEVPIRAHFSLPIVLAVALLLDQEVKIGHKLWLTAFAFWFGVYTARYQMGGTARVWLSTGAASVFVMLVTNLLDVKYLNVYLLVCMSVAAVLWCERAQIPKLHFAWVLLLSPYLLEIYLIHTYLFINLGLPTAVRYVASVVLIIAVAVMLNRIASCFAKGKFVWKNLQ
jgi:hypothetical protein